MRIRHVILGLTPTPTSTSTPIHRNQDHELTIDTELLSGRASSSSLKHEHERLDMEYCTFLFLISWEVSYSVIQLLTYLLSPSLPLCFPSPLPYHKANPISSALSLCLCFSFSFHFQIYPPTYPLTHLPIPHDTRNANPPAPAPYQHPTTLHNHHTAPHPPTPQQRHTHQHPINTARPTSRRSNSKTGSGSPPALQITKNAKRRLGP